MRSGGGILRIHAGLSLHGDTVVIGARFLGQRELSGLQVLEGGDKELHADVLARQEGREGLPVDGFQVERGDLRGLGDSLGDSEVAPVGPAVRLLVEFFFAFDQDVGELPVGRSPGVVDLGGQRIAQDLAHGFEEVFAHDLVLVRPDVEGCVLGADQLDGRAESAQVVDVLRVRQHGHGQGLGLVAGDLVSGAEDGVQLGMRIEHVLVEGSGDGQAMLLQDGHSGLDDFDLLGGQRHVFFLPFLFIKLVLENKSSSGWIEV